MIRPSQRATWQPAPLQWYAESDYLNVYLFMGYLLVTPWDMPKDMVPSDLIPGMTPCVQVYRSPVSRNMAYDWLVAALLSEAALRRSERVPDRRPGVPGVRITTQWPGDRWLVVISPILLLVLAGTGQLPLAMGLIGVYRRHRRRASGRCTQCGYSRMCLGERPCPECGASAEVARSVVWL